MVIAQRNLGETRGLWASRHIQNRNFLFKCYRWSKQGDVLLVAELSRLGRNMFEVINLINQLSASGVKLVFVRQPELSTVGPHGKLLLAIYSYFAEAEREFISVRTQQGLAAARARGKHLGRPKGSRDRERVLDAYREQIKAYLQLGIPLRRIRTILNPHLQKPISYPAYRYFVRQDPELLALWRTNYPGADSSHV